MKFRSYILLNALVFSFVAHQPIISNNLRKSTNEGKSPNKISFAENKGQIRDQNSNLRVDVLFSGSNGGVDFYLRNDGISYQFSKINSWKQFENGLNLHKTTQADEKTQVPAEFLVRRIDINWPGCNKNYSVETVDPEPGFDNYYVESCPKGALKVKKYKNIFYRNLYGNIHLHYYTTEQGFKYDYIVEPYGDYKKIKLQVNGVDKIEVQQDGSVLLETDFGLIREDAPIVYQEGHRLKAKWVLEENYLSFEISNSQADKQLIIDPVVRSWGTYYGGWYSDFSSSSAKDAFGNVYLVGTTISPNNIATSGSYQNILLAGNSNAFFAKFNSNGMRQWGTYYGSGNISGIACAFDQVGNIYLSGNEYNNYFAATSTIIATPGSYQSSFAGGYYDGFLVKFDSTGARQWATYFGGSNVDSFSDCAVDGTGNIYVVGGSSSYGIASAGSQQSVLGGGSDLFLVKFNTNGMRLWSTYCGGNQDDYSAGCAVDALGNVYVSGITDSPNNISTLSGYQYIYGGGYDTFLAKYDSLGTKVWGTYFGGTQEDDPGKCTVDVFGDIYLSGTTFSDSLIATSNAHQQVFGGTWDAFLVKYRASGMLMWATYYGGLDRDFGTGCSADELGNIYLSGYTKSKNGTSIATIGSPQSSHGGGGTDAFLAKFDGSGVRKWATYYGGSTGGYIEDRANSCVATSSVSVFMSGSTTSTGLDTISSAFSHQIAFGGQADAFLVKFSECDSFPNVTVNSLKNPLCNEETSILTANGAQAYVWNNTFDALFMSITPSVTTNYTVVGYDAAGCYNVAYLTQYVELCTNIASIEKNQNPPKIYPNPNNGQFVIDLNHMDKNMNVDLYNSTGQLIQTSKQNSETSIIDLRAHANGFYLLNISGSDAVIWRYKIIKND